MVQSRWWWWGAVCRSGLPGARCAAAPVAASAVPRASAWARAFALASSASATHAPSRRVSPPLIALALIVAASLLLVPASSALAQGPSGAWERVRPGARFEVSGRTVEVSGPARERWLAVRRDLGWTQATAASLSRPLGEALSGLAALADAGVLDVELALLAAHASDGDVSAERLAGWSRLVGSYGALRQEPERLRGAVAQLRLYELDSALAVASPACLGRLPTRLWPLVEGVAQQERMTPGRRYRAMQEPPPVVDREQLAAASRGPGGGVVAAALLALAAVSPGADAALPLHSELAEHADDCAVVAVRALARVPLVGVAGWPDARARLDLVLAEGLVPARWLWRAGVHQYLLANEEAVRDIGVWYARHVPSEEEGHRYFFLLRDAVDGDVATPRAAWPRLQAWTNPTYRWVVAEALRVRGDHEEATALLREVVDLDAGFVAAALSLASSQLQRGRVGAARITCDVLRLNAPPLPIYQFWQSRLEQRLGITGDAPDEESEPE